MKAPRMRVGVVSDGHNRVTLRQELSRVGHAVEHVEDTSDIADYELIVIAVEDSLLEDYVDKLAEHARRGQLFLHTCLSKGIQAMDSLETTGAVVMAAYPIGADRWVASSVDELGGTIVELLIGEMGGSILDVDDSERPRLAAAVTYSGFLTTLMRQDNMLRHLVDDPEVVDEIVLDNHYRSREVPSLETLESLHASITDVGRQRAFRDLARRVAEIRRTHDMELWAIQKEDL